MIEAGWKLPDIRAITVAQWQGVMRQDGPGSEIVTEHKDEDSFVKWLNKRRAEKGLEPLPLPSERKKETGMKDEDVKAGSRVMTSNGPAVVISADKAAGGWIVKREKDGLTAFHHAWDLTPLAAKPGKE